MWSSNTTSDVAAWASFFRMYAIAAMLDKREDLSWLKEKDADAYKDTTRSKIATV